MTDHAMKDNSTSNSATHGCAQWKDALLEAALNDAPTRDLAAHLAACPRCAQHLMALRAQRERMDALLPLVAQAQDPSPDFRARVLAAVEAGRSPKPKSFWLDWRWAAAAAATAAVFIALTLHHNASSDIPAEELASAQRLTEWRAPSDFLLQAPAGNILRAAPKLGESYLPGVPARPLAPSNLPSKMPGNTNQEN